MTQLGPEERAEAMCRMRAEGRTLQEIGLEFSLTRERVRQIIRDAGGPGVQDAAAARAARAGRQRQELRDRALQACREMPGCTAEQAAAVLGVSAAELRAALGNDAGRVLVTTHQPRVVFADADILEHLRQAAILAGEPLTVRMYEDMRGEFGGASAPLVLQRFGTWRAACEMAGVVPGKLLRDSYQRRWNRDQLIGFVAEYLSRDGARGSFADYERWARIAEGAPSGQTIRTQVGSWSRAKTEAQEVLAQRWSDSQGQAELWGGAGSGSPPAPVSET